MDRGGRTSLSIQSMYVEQQKGLRNGEKEWKEVTVVVLGIRHELIVVNMVWQHCALKLRTIYQYYMELKEGKAREKSGAGVPIFQARGANLILGMTWSRLARSES